MADIKTKQITRNKLATVFKSHELVKEFESITQDVRETLPSAALDAQLTANDARSRAINAQDDVDVLTELFNALDAMVKTQRNSNATLSKMQDRISTLEKVVFALYRDSDTDALRREIRDLQKFTFTS